jgi:CSLREA domain-containing protein
MRRSRKLFRCLASLTVVLVGLLSWLFPLGRFWSALPPSARAAGVVFTVNSAADTNDGVCNAANCTLRKAINAANATPDSDNIVFNIPGTGVKTILAPTPPAMLNTSSASAPSLTHTNQECPQSAVCSP